MPNVVHSCGAMVRDGVLFVPYAMADTATRIAAIEMADLLDGLERSGP